MLLGGFLDDALQGELHQVLVLLGELAAKRSKLVDFYDAHDLRHVEIIELHRVPQGFPFFGFRKMLPFNQLLEQIRLLDVQILAELALIGVGLLQHLVNGGLQKVNSSWPLPCIRAATFVWDNF